MAQGENASGWSKKGIIMTYRARFCISLTLIACCLGVVDPGVQTGLLAQEAQQGTGKARDDTVMHLEPVVITGRAADLLGIADSSSQGQVGQAELETRPLLRTGEVLEVIPGMAVTQHSGTGKANQYFLRESQAQSHLRTLGQHRDLSQRRLCLP
jgi:hypothetical protein